MKRFNHLTTIILITMAMAIASAPSARAAVRYWDIVSGDGGTITGGSGIWSTGGVNWNTGSGDTTWANYDDAYFGGSPGTVTISGGVFANRLNFTSDGYIITGATLNMGNPGGINNFNVTGANTATINANISQPYATAIQKIGTGTLVLNGIVSSTAGNNRIEAGTLKIGGGSFAGSVWVADSGGTTGTLEVSGGTLTSSGLSVVGTRGNGTLNVTGGTAQFNGGLYMGYFGIGWVSSSAVNLSSGAISVGTGGAGDFILGQDNDGGASSVFTQTGGVFTFNGNVMNIGNWGAGTQTLSVSGGTFTSNTGNMVLGVRGTATLNVGGTGAVNLPGLSFGHLGVPGSTSIVNLTGGTLTIGANGIFRARTDLTGNFNFNGGVLQAAASNATFMQGLSTANVQGGGAIIETPSGVGVTIAQNLLNGGGGGGLTKTGAGSLTLTGANTYTGATAINGGTLTANTVADAGSSGIGIGTSGGLVFGGGALQFTGASGSTARTLALNSGGGTIDVGTGSTLSLAGGLWSGNGGFTKVGGGTLTVGNNYTAANRFNIGTDSGGTFTMTAGVLNISPSNYLTMGDNGADATYIQTGGIVNYTAGNGSYLGNGSGGTSAMTISGGTFTQSLEIMRIGQNGSSTGILNVGGGAGTAHVSVPQLSLGNNSGSAKGMVNLLANGILAVGLINKGSGTGTINFNGGTLQPTTSTATFLQGLTAAYVQSGGAIIDTPTGIGVTIGQNLLDGGGGSLIKNGAGSLTLSGANTFTGVTTINGGTLAISSDGNLGTAPGAATPGQLSLNGGALNITANGVTINANRGIFIGAGGGTITTPSANQTTVYQGIRTGSGPLTINGTGDVNMQAASGSATGGTTINGVRMIGAGSSSMFGTGSITINAGSGNAGGSLYAYGGSTWANNFYISGYGANSNDGTPRGALRFDNATVTGTVTLTGPAGIGATGNSTATINGKITGAQPLTIMATGGDVALNGPNDYSGGTTIAGSARVRAGSNSSAVGTGSVTINSGGQFYASGAGTWTNPFFIAGFGGNSVDGTQRGAMRLDNGATASGTITLNANAAIDANTGIGTVSGKITGGYALTINNADAGTIRLSGNNDYTGDTIVKNGVLVLNSAGGTAIPGIVQFGTGSASVQPYIRATQNNQFGPTSVINFLNNPGGWTRFELQGTTQTLAGISDSLGAGVIQNSESGVGGTSTLIVNNSTDYSYNGYLRNGSAGTLGLTKDGTGKLTLSGGNITYTSATAINNGTLVFQGSYGSTSLSIASGAVLELNVAGGTTDYATSSLTGTGTLLKTGAGTARWGGTAATFNLGSGALIDVQDGTFVGGSSANENWTSNLADLNVGANGFFRGVEANVRVDALTGTGTIASGYGGAGYSAFTFGVDNGNGTFAGVLADDVVAGNFVKTGSGTQVLSGANTYTGTTTISGGTLQIGGGGTSGLLASQNVQNDANLVFNRSDASTYSGKVSGTGDLIKEGAGELTLDGAHDYTGATIINDGVIKLTAASAPTPGSLYWLDANAGATVVTSGSSVIGWLDKNGNVGSFTQGTPANQPTYVAGAINGLPAVRFNGSTTQLTLGSSTTPLSVFIVNNPNSPTGGDRGIWGQWNVDYGIREGTGGWWGDKNNNDFIQSGGANGVMYVNGATAATLPVTVGSPQLVEAIRTSGATAFGNTGLGRYTTAGGGGRYYSGDIGEVLAYGTALNYTDRKLTENYLLWKWLNTFSDVLPTNTALQIASGAGLDLGGGNQTVGSLAGAGFVTNSFPNLVTFTVGTDNTSTTFSGGIMDGTGSIALTKTGAGQLTLTGVNTYTGNTIINSGTLEIGNGGATGSILGNVTDNGNLTFNHSDDITFPGAINGSGGVIKQGAGSLTLSGNSYAGTTIINDGMLIAGNGTALGSPAGGTTVNTGAALDINGQNLGAESVTINGTGIGGAGALVNYGGSQINALQFLTLGSDATVGGTGRLDVRGGSSLLNLNGNTLTKTGPNFFGLVSTTVNDGTIVVNQGGLGLHLNTVVAGTGQITINNAQLDVGNHGGTVVVTRPILANGGLISTSNPATIGSTITFAAATTTALNSGGGNLTLSGNFLGSGTVYKAGGQSVFLGGNNSGFSGIYSNASVNTFFSSASAGSASATWITTSGNLANAIGGTPTVHLGALGGDGGQLGNDTGGSVVTYQIGALNTDTTYSGTIVDSVGGGGTTAITKVGTGTLTLTGANTYSAGTAVNNGVLSVDNTTGSATGTGAVTVNSGATLAGMGTISGAVTVNSGGHLAPGNSVGTITVGGLNLTPGSMPDWEFNGGANDQTFVTTSGGLTINGGDFSLYNEGTTTAFSTLGTYNLINYSGGIGGIGPGALGVANPVGGASYAFAADGTWVKLTIGTGQVWNGGSGVDSYWQTGGVGGNWSGATVSAGDALTFAGVNRLINTNNFGANTQFAGFTFDGSAGAFTLDGTNPVNLIGNVVNNSANTQTINLPVVLDGSGRMFNTASGDIVVNGTIGEASGNWGVVKSGANKLTLTGNNTFTGTSIVNAGTLEIGAGSTSGSIQGNIVNDANLVFNRSDASTYSGDISGTGGLTKQSVGTLTLSGASTYTGNTTISAGTVVLNGPSAAPVSGTTFWLDASAAASQTLQIGDQVSQWSDKLGGAINATQGTASARPTLVAGQLNGLPIVDFGPDGSGQWMAFNQISNIRSVFWVMEGYNFLLSDDNNYHFHRGGDDSPTANIWHGTHTSANIKSGSTYLNGTLVDGTVTPLPATYSLIDVVTIGNVEASRLLNDRNITSRYGGQQIGEIVIYNTALTDPQRQAVEAYLNAKWFGTGMALPPSSLVEIASGATLDLNGSYQAVAGLADIGGSGGLVTNSAASIATLVLSPASGSQTFSGTIEDNGSANAINIVKTGAGAQTLSGNNTYRGGTAVHAGTLTMGSANALGTAPAPLTVNDGVLELNGNSLGVTAFNGLGGKIINSAGATAATLTVGNNNLGGYYAGTIEDAGGSIALAKIGTGTMILTGTGANTFSGDTTMTAGSLVLSKPDGVNAIGGNLVNASVGSSFVQWAGDEQIPDTATISFGTTHLHLELLGHVETVAGISATAGFGVIENRQTETGINNNGTLIINNTANFSYNAIIRNNTGGSGSGVLNITKDGPGTLFLSRPGPNQTFDYTGLTTVNGGILQIGGGFGGDGAIKGDVVINSGGTFKQTQGNIIDNDQKITINSGGTYDMSGVSDALSGIEGAGTVINFGGFELDFYRGNLIFTGTLTGNGAITARGRGDAGTQTFAGVETIGGNFILGSSESHLVNFGVTGGTFTVNGGNFILANTAGSTANFTQTGGTTRFTGNTFLGISNFGGPSTMIIGGGTFTSIVMPMNLGVRGNGTLTVDGTGFVELPGLYYAHPSTSGGTSEVNLDGGTLRVGVVGHYNGTSIFNFNGGTLQASGPSATFMQGLTAINVKGGGAIVDTDGSNITIGQSLLDAGGGGGLTKSGAGVLTLTQNNTYTGATTINAGTLKLADATTNNSIANSPTITVAAGTELDGTSLLGGQLVLSAGQVVRGDGKVNAATTVGGGAVLSPGTSPGVLTFDNQMTWTAGGIYHWEIADWTGMPTNDWDYIQLNGFLDISNLDSANQFTIEIAGLGAGQVPANFDRSIGTAFPIMTTTLGIGPGFDASWFVLNTGSFGYSSSTASWSIYEQGNTLWLQYTALIPEPTVVALLGLGGLMLLFGRRLRKRS